MPVMKGRMENGVLLLDRLGLVNLEDMSEEASIGFYYRHEQLIASDEWQIQHNLGKKPNLSCEDSTGRVIFGAVTHDSDNHSTVRFKSGVAGNAICS